MILSLLLPDSVLVSYSFGRNFVVLFYFIASLARLEPWTSTTDLYLCVWLQVSAFTGVYKERGCCRGESGGSKPVPRFPKRC
jgi:hypothetical protein